MQAEKQWSDCRIFEADSPISRLTTLLHRDSTSQTASSQLGTCNLQEVNCSAGKTSNSEREAPSRLTSCSLAQQHSWRKFDVPFHGVYILILVSLRDSRSSKSREKVAAVGEWAEIRRNVRRILWLKFAWTYFKNAFPPSPWDRARVSWHLSQGTDQEDDLDTEWSSQWPIENQSPNDACAMRYWVCAAFLQATHIPEISTEIWAKLLWPFSSSGRYESSKIPERISRGTRRTGAGIFWRELISASRTLSSSIWFRSSAQQFLFQNYEFGGKICHLLRAIWDPLFVLGKIMCHWVKQRRKTLERKASVIKRRART